MKATSVRTLVVIPVWNGEAYLREAVLSVLHQEGEAFDVLVVDDGSTDQTREILEALEAPALQVHARPHLGLIPTINHAITYAHQQGYTYIVRMDADDISLPGRIQALVACMDATGADAASSNCWYINESGQVVGTSTVARTPWLVAWEIRHGLRGLIQGASIFRVPSLVACGMYREAFKVAEDTDLFLRLSEQGRLTNLKTFLYQIRQRDGSRSRTNAWQNILYSNYALDCARRRRRGQPEISFAAYEARPLALAWPVYLEALAMAIWNWTQGAPGRKWAIPFVATLCPFRTFSRIARRIL